MTTAQDGGKVVSLTHRPPEGKARENLSIPAYVNVFPRNKRETTELFLFSALSFNFEKW
jgi:hypothetical protein